MSTQSDRRRNAIDVMRTLSGGSYDPERAANAMVRRNGALGSFGLDHILGTIWARPQLSRRDRSLIVIAFLATIGAQDELDVHIRGGIAHGLSREEIEEIICQVAGYAGFPMAMHASRIVQSVWCDLDDVERRHAYREAVLVVRHVVLRREERLTVLDQACLGSRAAHVESDRFVNPERSRDLGCRHDARGRT